MREMLFRGKIIELCQYHGQWLEGFYGVDEGKPLIAIQQKNGLHGFFCDPLTVGQYTGLKDRNGTRIFEGDILQIEQYGNPGSRVCPIYFGKYIDADSDFDYPFIGFYFKIPDGCGNIGALLSDGFEYEVIGNVFDNPELMEVNDG